MVERRLTVVVYLLNLFGMLSTAAAMFYVRAEVMETRIMIIERINEAGRDYVDRREFDRLSGRVDRIQENKP